MVKKYLEVFFKSFPFLKYVYELGFIQPEIMFESAYIITYLTALKELNVIFLCLIETWRNKKLV